MTVKKVQITKNTYKIVKVTKQPKNGGKRK